MHACHSAAFTYSSGKSCLPSVCGRIPSFKQKQSQTTVGFLLVGVGAGIQHYCSTSAEGTVVALKALGSLLSSFSSYVGVFFLFWKVFNVLHVIKFSSLYN